MTPPSAGADDGMHHQTTQEGAESIEVGAMQLLDLFVATDVVLDVVLLAGREAMEHLVEAQAHRDQHGDDSQRIEKCGQRCGSQTQRQRERDARADAEQDLGEHEQQQLAHEVDARDHEHEQQDDGRRGDGFVVDGCGVVRPINTPSIASKPPGCSG
jgi:hypothetical protein